MHPYLLDAASSSAIGTDSATSRRCPVETQAPSQCEVSQPLHRLPTVGHPPSPPQDADERILFNEKPPLSTTPLRPTRKRVRSRMFTSANPSSLGNPTNAKSWSATTLVTEDYHPKTRREPAGFRTSTSRHDPGSSEFSIKLLDLIIPPPPRNPAPLPPSLASPYSAFFSHHSGPGNDSDSTSTFELKARDHGKGGDEDAGFDSDDALSLPAFYQNPRASYSDETFGTTGSIGSIGTMDTMGAALRSLGPAQRPTIGGIRWSAGSVDENGAVVMTGRRTSNVGEAQVKIPTLKAKSTIPLTQAQIPRADGVPGEKEKEVKVEGKGLLRRKDHRSLKTPSTLALSTNLVGVPTSGNTSTTNAIEIASTTSTHAHSSTVSSHKASVGVNDDVRNPHTADPSASAHGAQYPPRPPRRAHRIPPPLVLRPHAPAPSTNLEVQAGLTPKSLTSFRFHPPPTPLSPALSLVSTMSALSTVSTIAAVMSNRPKTKPPRTSEKELRRRRFLKLTKTLGEDVPPEFVSVKAAVPRHSKTNSFGARGKFGGSQDERGTGKRNSMVENGKAVGRVRKKRKGGSDRRGTARARHSIAFSPLEPNFPSIPEDHDRYAEPLSPAPPNVLRRYPSIRRRSTSNPNGLRISETSSHSSVDPTPVLPMEPEEEEPTVVTPYFEDHPFRLTVHESSSTSEPPIPRSANLDANTATTKIRGVNGSDSREAGHGGGSSSCSMNNPWVRTSLALPLSYDTPFIEYALPCGIDRKVAQARLGVGHHRHMSSLDAACPRRISTIEPPSDDTQIEHRSSVNVSGVGGGLPGGKFCAIGGLRQVTGTYLNVPQEVEGDEGKRQNMENGVYRKERRQGWSGEWNQPHIQTVIEKLRQL